MVGQEQVNEKMDRLLFSGGKETLKTAADLGRWTWGKATSIAGKLLNALFEGFKNLVAEINPSGKQTASAQRMGQGQNQGVSQIELNAENLNDFEKIAKKQGLDYTAENAGPVKTIAEKPSILAAINGGNTEQQGQKEQQQGQAVTRLQERHEITGDKTLEELRETGEPLSKVTIKEGDIGLFQSIAAAHGVEMAIKAPEGRAAEEKTNIAKTQEAKAPVKEAQVNRYVIYFKTSDTGKMNDVIKEYTQKRMESKETAKDTRKKPSIKKQLNDFDKAQRERKDQKPAERMPKETKKITEQRTA